VNLDYIIGNSVSQYPGILRSYLDEPTADASDWTDQELLMYVNAEHKHLLSVIRGFNQDWFGRRLIFPLQPSFYEYYIPTNCVNPRRMEFINASSVSGTSPNYSVNEETCNAQEIDNISLNEKSSLPLVSSNTRFAFGTGYYIFGDQIIFEPNQNINSSLYARLWYLPSAPDLHRGVPVDFSLGSFTFADNLSPTTLGRVVRVDNYYQGMFIEITSGTGAGQIRRITSYDGDNAIATIDPTWTDVPDLTSTYSIVSPIPEDYQELLVLGAAMRAKGIKVEDDTSGIGAIYTALRSDLDNALIQRNHQSPRHVIGRRR